MHQTLTLLTDGDDKLRALQLAMRPKATHLVDGLHRTMQLTGLEPDGKGLVQCAGALGEERREQIEPLQWSLWHGQVDKALGQIDALASSIAPCSETYARCNPLVQALSAWRTYSGNNRHLIPHDGER
jgi:hypothetical protein